MRLTTEEEKQFREIADKIIQAPSYQPMKTYVQHGHVTTYEHCLRVARCAFWMNLRMHTNETDKEIIQAALLHDYYLYDWHQKGHRLHGYRHPDLAAENARRDFEISDRVETAIRTHMWPLTLRRFPRSRVGWLLTVADKICSCRETIFR